MKNKQEIQKFKQSEMLDSTLSQVKGGILLTCEEKRGSLLGIPVTYNSWSIKNDNRLWLTVKM